MVSRHASLFLCLFLTASGLVTGGSAGARAAELLMLEQPGCVWCARFNAEIAPAWPNTEQGARAPLRRVDIMEEWPADLEFVMIERFTPTFVLIDNGREYGRIRGYPGDDFFWFLVDELIAKLPGEDKAQESATD